MCTVCPNCIYKNFNSKKVKKFISCDEYVNFIGFYNLEDGDVNNNIHVSKCNIIKNNEGYNIKTTRFFYIEDKKSLPGEKFINETYDITSYFRNCDCNKKLEKINGMISFGGLYNDNLSENGKTEKNIIKFNTLSSSGIYSEISSVIIDCSENVRKMYFLGKKNKYDIKINRKEKTKK